MYKIVVNMDTISFWQKFKCKKKEEKKGILIPKTIKI